MTDYKVVYRDHNGNELITLTDWFLLEYIRKKNEFGSLYIDLPVEYPTDLFKIDGRLEVWRRVDGSYYKPDMNAVWFIRLIRYKTDEQGREKLHILAHDAIHLLERRLVAYNAATAYSSKEDNADDMIKAIMRENYGSLADDATRNLGSRLAIDPDYGLCPSIKKDFHWRKVLPVLQEISDSSKTLGTDLWYDVVYETQSTLRFRTYANQLGQNRGLSSGNPLVLSLPVNSLSYASVAFDHTDERNYIYAGGRGEKDSRILGEAYDANRMSISPYNRCEDFISVDSESDIPADDEAKARLTEAAPRTAFNGHVSQAKDAIYGIDYNYGDTVVAKYGKFAIDVTIDTVHVKIGEDGFDNVQVFARNLEDSQY
jgi:hypothetical protein